MIARGTAPSVSSKKAALDRIRAICFAMPEVEEKISHGAPSFHVRGKMLVMFLDDHHGDGRLALWLAAPDGMQQALVEAAPEHYFRPPYVGHRGWLGVRLDRGLDLEVVKEHLDTALATVS